MRRIWILGIALILAVLLLARWGLPAFVENQLNRVTPHAPWVVSEKARRACDEDLHFSFSGARTWSQMNRWIGASSQPVIIR